VDNGGGQRSVEEILGDQVFRLNRISLAHNNLLSSNEFARARALPIVL